MKNTYHLFTRIGRWISNPKTVGIFIPTWMRKVAIFIFLQGLFMAARAQLNNPNQSAGSLGRSDTLVWHWNRADNRQTANALDRLLELEEFNLWQPTVLSYQGEAIRRISILGRPDFIGIAPITSLRNLPAAWVTKIALFYEGQGVPKQEAVLCMRVTLFQKLDQSFLGKGGGGLGSKSRYDGGAWMSHYGKSNRLLVGAGLNNRNKSVANLQELLTSIDPYPLNAGAFQRNIKLNQGILKPLGVGAQYQFDIKPRGRWGAGVLTTGYFINRAQQLLSPQTTVYTFLGKDSFLTQHIQFKLDLRDTRHSFEVGFRSGRAGMQIGWQATVEARSWSSDRVGAAWQERTRAGEIASNLTQLNQSGSLNRFNLVVDLVNKPSSLAVTSLNMNYRLLAFDGKNKMNNYSVFKSPISDSGNRVVNRWYPKWDSSGVHHQIRIQYPGLKGLLFGHHDLGGVQLGLQVDGDLWIKQYSARVLDWDTVARKYNLNPELTFRRYETTYSLIPGLKLSKYFFAHQNNRVNQWFWGELKIAEQFQGVRHEPDIDIPHFTYDYTRFVPAGSLLYYVKRQGGASMRYTLSYDTRINYPVIGDVAPLFDNAHYWRIPVANPILRPETDRSLGLLFQYANHKPQWPATLDVDLSVGRIANKMIPKFIIDPIGRVFSKPVNKDGFKYLRGQFVYQQALVLPSGHLNWKASYFVSLRNALQYSNNNLNLVAGDNHKTSLFLGFRRSAFFGWGVEKGIGWFEAKHEGYRKNGYRSQHQFTRVNVDFQLLKSAKVFSDITFNKVNSKKNPTVYYTVWNAGWAIALLKNKKGVLQCMVMDLLNRNQSLVNNTSGNNQLLTFNNALRRYFMVQFFYALGK